MELLLATIPFMKVAIVVGTRPEIIKMSPIIRECQSQGIEFILIHSNQHYSPEMDEVFFLELELPPPHYNLNAGSGAHGVQTGKMMSAIEPILQQERPDVVLTQGDTNTVLAASIVASKLDCKLGHVEAGLRSYDRSMPEELNRIMTDHISDYLFSVSQTQEDILLKEGISKDKIFTVGNTIVDAVKSNLAIAEEKSDVLTRLEIKQDKYILATVHRDSNVDESVPLQEVINTLEQVANKYQVPVVWPIHPRSRKNIEKFKIQLPSCIQLTEPVGYMDFVQLQRNSLLIMTDSGGIQEEACILGVPCITLRSNTERPETLDVGANILVGRSPEKALSAAETLLKSNGNWENPFGEGTTAKQILAIIKDSSDQSAN